MNQENLITIDLRCVSRLVLFGLSGLALEYLDR